MIKGRMPGVAPDDLAALLLQIGDDKAWAEEFVNIFSHQVSAHQVFAPERVQAWMREAGRTEQDPVEAGVP
jgi:hypothetical protein